MIKDCKLKIWVFLITAVLLGIACKSYAVDFWIQQSTPPTGVTLLRCSFPDTLNGWACGDMGTIMHTSNGGVNWSFQTSPVNFYLHDVFFINNTTGWIISNEFFYEGSIILSTTDGGNNWDTTQFSDTTVFLTTVYFSDINNGWLGSIGGHIYKTSNAGLNWNLTLNDTGTFSNYRIERFRFYSPDFGFALGGQIDIVGTLWRTTNNGGFWTTSGLSPEPIFDLHYFDSLNILAVGGDPDFGAFRVISTNAGVTWDYHSLEMFGQGMTIAARTPSELWVPLAYAENWAATFNGGTNWVEIPVTQQKGVWDAQFVSPMHGWAVGDSGTILKFNPEAVGIQNQNTQIPSSLYLSQNFPNPFNPFTTIEYKLEEPGDVEIVIYDINGRLIRSVPLGRRSSGSYKYHFDGSGFPSGVYYYKLILGEFSDTKKMVILK
jgi:photosystem II stability/assembly factor-like uncharacterized protein